jgi:hypothetical protein
MAGSPADPAGGGGLDRHRRGGPDAAFVDHADGLLAEPAAPQVLGIDETRRGRLRWSRRLSTVWDGGDSKVYSQGTVVTARSTARAQWDGKVYSQGTVVTARSTARARW